MLFPVSETAFALLLSVGISSIADATFSIAVVALFEAF